MASILTGRYPREHGLVDHSAKIRVPGGARRFAEAGFYTAAVLNNNNLDSVFGFSDGFEQFQNFRNEDHDQPFELLPDLLRGGGRRRFLVVFHTNIVHDYFLDKPYYRDESGAEPTPPAGKKAWTSWPAEYHEVLRARYRRGVRYCLERIRANVLSRLDLGETLVVITSDHGEGLYSPRTYHAGRLHNDLLNVPLVVLNETGEDPTLFSQTELLDRIALWLGLSDVGVEPSAVRGEDFAYIYRHDFPEGSNRLDYKSSPGLSVQCWYDGRFKTIVSRSPFDGYSHIERYDLVTDWEETSNLAAVRDDPGRREGKRHEWAAAERMRNHGEALLAIVHSRMQQGCWPEGAELLEAVQDVFLPYLVEHTPTVWYWTGLCKEASGDNLGAIAAFQRARGSEAAAGEDKQSLLVDYHLACCYVVLGRDGEAISLFQCLLPALEGHSDPELASLRWQARYLVATAYERMGQIPKAIACLLSSLVSVPDPENRARIVARLSDLGFSYQETFAGRAGAATAERDSI